MVSANAREFLNSNDSSNSNSSLRVSSMHMSKVIPNLAVDLMLFAPGNKRLRVAVYANFFPVAYQEKARAKRVDRLKLGAAADSTKQQQKEEKKKQKPIKGFDIDLIRGFCRLANLTPVFVAVDDFYSLWETPASWNDHFDLAVGGIGRSRWRNVGGVEWSVPYFKIHRTIVYNLKDPILTFPGGVTGKLAGTMGSTGMLDASRRMAKAKKRHLLEYRDSSDEKDLRDLLAGRLQGLMRGSFVGKALVKKHPKQLGMIKPWKAMPEVVGPGGEVFAFPCRRGSGLAGMLNSYIGLILANGAMKALVKKHGM